jgi:uncharacterized protein
MQFLLVAYDGKDPDAAGRRMKVRELHLANSARLRKSGNFLFGRAILGENDNMIGSMIVYEYADRNSLDAMLREEPYITGKVWQEIDIRPFRKAHSE